MSSDMSSFDIVEVELRALKLRPGMAVQTRGVAPGAIQEEAQFLAAIEGKGVMVGPHGAAGGKNTLKAGDRYTVRGFTGQYDFSFVSQVIQVFDVPFAYALMVYPSSVLARMVRQSVRMTTSVPAKLTMPYEDDPLDVTLIDVSPFGGMIHAPVSVGVIGDVLDLNLTVQLEGEPVNLTIAATVCHSNKAPAGQEGVNVGMSFKSISPADKLVLHYLIQAAEA